MRLNAHSNNKTPGLKLSSKMWNTVKMLAFFWVKWIWHRSTVMGIRRKEKCEHLRVSVDMQGTVRTNFQKRECATCQHWIGEIITLYHKKKIRISWALQKSSWFAMSCCFMTYIVLFFRSHRAQIMTSVRWRVRASVSLTRGSERSTKTATYTTTFAHFSKGYLACIHQMNNNVI